MGVKDKTEIQRRFEEIMEKKLNNKFISSGDLIRFRDACIEFGKQEQKKEFEEIIQDTEIQWLSSNCRDRWLYFKERIKQLEGVKRK